VFRLTLTASGTMNRYYSVGNFVYFVWQFFATWKSNHEPTWRFPMSN